MCEEAEVLLDTTKIVGLLSNDGPLSRIFSGFEERLGQQNLAKTICQCFNEKAIGVFEAGTGIGKSLAYLLPGIQWAFSNNTKILVSTSTINLQQQLVEKDAPLALKILGFDTEEYQKKIVLVKGRRNFLCLRRFYQTSGQGDLFSADPSEFASIKKQFSDAGFTGSRDELAVYPSHSLWASICSESDNCLLNKCSYYENCYVMKMKKKADSAHVLIANHHLLFSDLQAKLQNQNFDVPAVLPAFKDVVIDEAHAIEDAARSGFSSSVNALFIKKQLNALYRPQRIGKSKPSGTLQTIITLSARSDLYAETIQRISQVFEASTRLENFALSLVPQENTWSFLQAPEQDITAMYDEVKSFLVPLSLLNKNIYLILQNISEDTTDELEPETKNAVHETTVFFSRLKEVETFFESYCHPHEENESILWFEKITENGNIHIEFYNTPLRLDTFMQEALFKPLDTVICTSATLQISNRFDFMLETFGLKHFSEKKICTDVFVSPFPYKERVLFSIPSDAPLPVDEQYTNFVLEAILHLILASRGRALVLFTSYTMLRDAVQYVQEHINDTSIAIFYQGQYDRAKLLKDFKENIYSCLFATESFWTGVDIPGESLSHVILVKLPFDVPSHPIAFAKSKYIEQQGRKPFFELSLPNAVIKFKQGYGRLMRSKTDRGAITVLDSRLLKKNYGAFFLQSVPESRKVFASFDKILYNIDNFINEGRDIWVH